MPDSFSAQYNDLSNKQEELKRGLKKNKCLICKNSFILDRNSNRRPLLCMTVELGHTFISVRGYKALIISENRNITVTQYDDIVFSYGVKNVTELFVCLGPYDNARIIPMWLDKVRHSPPSFGSTAASAAAHEPHNPHRKVRESRYLRSSEPHAHLTPDSRPHSSQAHRLVPPPRAHEPAASAAAAAAPREQRSHRSRSTRPTRRHHNPPPQRLDNSRERSRGRSRSAHPKVQDHHHLRKSISAAQLAESLDAMRATASAHPQREIRRRQPHQPNFFQSSAAASSEPRARRRSAVGLASAAASTAFHAPHRPRSRTPTFNHYPTHVVKISDNQKILIYYPTWGAAQNALTRIRKAGNPERRSNGYWGIKITVKEANRLLPNGVIDVLNRREPNKKYTIDALQEAIHRHALRQ